jgi:hypothetical protein
MFVFEQGCLINSKKIISSPYFNIIISVLVVKAGDSKSKPWMWVQIPAPPKN